MQSARKTYPEQPTGQVKASYRALRREQAAREQRWQVEEERRGLLGAWLALTAPPLAVSSASLAERERRRKAELSAYVLFGILLMGLALIPNGLANQPTLISAGVIIVSAVLAGALNRADRTTAAALLLIGAFGVALGSALVTAPTLDLMWMPALDFFAVPVLLAGLLLSRRAPFAVAALGTAAVIALLELKPRDPTLAHMVAQLGIYHFMVRPISLMVIVAIASWLWARSVEQSIVRADRAEEIAAMEHVLAEQKRQMERGIQSLLETHVRVANGDFSARAASGQDNVLWQIAVSLNNLLSRLGKLAQADHRLQRTEAEIDRLASALEETRAGRTGSWPSFSGTRVDRLLRLLGSTQLQRLPAPSPAPSQGRPLDAPVAGVPEGVPGGAIPPWDGSGLTPMMGVWRADSGHYSTARDTLASYGSGPLRAANPSAPLGHDPLTYDSQPEPRATWPRHPAEFGMPGKGSSSHRPSSGPAPSDPDRFANLPFTVAPINGHDTPASTPPTSPRHAPTSRPVSPPPRAQHPASAPSTHWSAGPLPPLPPSPWEMPDPPRYARPGQAGSPPASGWRIVGGSKPLDDDEIPDGLADPVRERDEPLDNATMFSLEREPARPDWPPFPGPGPLPME